MEFIKGMDISMVKELEVSGASYYINGKQEDLFRILKECGTTMVRLRIWSDPFDEMGNSYGGGGNDLQTTIEIAGRTVENGMDISMVKELEVSGASYYINGKQEDLFRILKECGTTMVRLRIWSDPFDEMGNSYGGGGNDLQTTIEIAGRTVENGMDFMLDFHYSDFWADPAKQIKPKAWQKLRGEALETAVYLHTVNTLKALKNHKLIPKMVQVGNEITKGLLWPDGYVEQTENMARLLRAGIRGVREECPGAGIVLHLDFGTNNELYRQWFDRIAPFALDYDVIGMSYYPHWNGSLEQLQNNMNDISARYGKNVLVVETSIGYTTDTLGCKGIVYSEKEEEATGYPATQEGQEQFLRDLMATVRKVKEDRGIGVFYWEPAWLPIPDCTWASTSGSQYMQEKMAAGNAMANMALFDAAGNANSALLHMKTM